MGHQKRACELILKTRACKNMDNRIESHSVLKINCDPIDKGLTSRPQNLISSDYLGGVEHMSLVLLSRQLKNRWQCVWNG